MKSTSFVAALLTLLATTFVALPSALACSVAPAYPEAIVPVNGDRVSPSVEILVVGGGIYDSEGTDASLKDRAGNEIELEVEFIERAAFAGWAIVYRPVEALSPTAYDFFASFESPGSDAPNTIATSFEVRQQDLATLAKPRVSSWATVYFAPQVEGQCQSYSSLTRVELDQAREGDSPLWFEVELSNEDRSKVVTRAVVPGLQSDDGASIRREFREGFAVGCVAVTAVGPAGERGESFESCEPTLCGRADGRADDLSIDWETVDECQGSAPGQPSSGGSSSGSSSGSGGCSVGGMTERSSLWWPAVLALFVLACARRPKKCEV